MSKRLIAVAALLASCTLKEPAEQSRVYEPLPPIVVELRSGLPDTILLNPLGLVADDSTVAVYDDGRKAIELFDLNGRLRAVVGSEGRGPGELQHVSSMMFGPDGMLHALDQENARWLVVTPRGSIRREVLLDGEAAEADRLYVEPTGEVMVVRLTRPSLLRLSPDGGVTDRRTIPWGRFGSAEPMALYAKPLRSDSAGLVLALYYGGGVVFGDHTGEPFPYLGHPPVPEVVTNNTGEALVTEVAVTELAVRDASVMGNLLLTVPGQSALRSRVIDVYDLSAPGYLQSYRSDRRVNLVALTETRIFTVEGEAEPILVVRRRPGR